MSATFPAPHHKTLTLVVNNEHPEAPNNSDSHRAHRLVAVSESLHAHRRNQNQSHAPHLHTTTNNQTVSGKNPAPVAPVSKTTITEPQALPQSQSDPRVSEITIAQLIETLTFTLTAETHTIDTTDNYRILRAAVMMTGQFERLGLSLLYADPLATDEDFAFDAMYNLRIMSLTPLATRSDVRRALATTFAENGIAIDATVSIVHPALTAVSD